MSIEPVLEVANEVATAAAVALYTSVNDSQEEAQGQAATIGAGHPEFKTTTATTTATAERDETNPVSRLSGGSTLAENAASNKNCGTQLSLILDRNDCAARIGGQCDDDPLQGASNGRSVSSEILIANAKEEAPSTVQRTGLALPVLTNSRMKAARGCMRYDKLRYRLGYKPAREQTTLRFGSLIHAGLEAWWLGFKMASDERLDAALAAITNEKDPFEKAKAEALIFGYHERWLDERLETLAVEAEFIGPLVNPETGAASRTWLRRGKVDAIVREIDTGRTMLVEHKTSAEDIRQGSDYWLRLRMDSQVSTYFEGGRFLGYEIDGCIYDVIGKPGERPKEIPVLDADGLKIVVDDVTGQRCRTKDGKKWRQSADDGQHVQTRPETPPEYKNRLLLSIADEPSAYYQRGEVVRLELDMREALLDDWQFAQTLKNSIRDDVAPRNPDNCKKYGRLCEFFGPCTGAASLDDPNLFRKLDNVNSELSGVSHAIPR